MFRLMKEQTPCGETETVFQTESYERAVRTRRTQTALRPWKLSACLAHGYADFWVEIPGATIDRPHFNSLEVAELEVKQALHLHNREWRAIAHNRHADIVKAHAEKTEPRTWTGGNLPAIGCTSRVAWDRVFRNCSNPNTRVGDITLGMVGGIK